MLPKKGTAETGKLVSNSCKPAWVSVHWNVSSLKKFSKLSHAGLLMLVTKLPVQICIHYFPALDFLGFILAFLMKNGYL